MKGTILVLTLASALLFMFGSASGENRQSCLKDAEHALLRMKAPCLSYFNETAERCPSEPRAGIDECFHNAKVQEKECNMKAVALYAGLVKACIERHP